jgi:hypothetical protein
MGQKIKIGLWKRETKAGVKMLAGSAKNLKLEGDFYVNIYPHDLKEGNQPDYNLVLQQKEEQPSALVGPMTMPLPKNLTNVPEEELPY